MKGWRLIFASAAAFNMLVGFALLLAADSVLRGMGLPAMTAREAFFVDLAALLIIIFGLGYAMAERRPEAHAGIVFLGLVGKSMMPIIAGMHVLRGAIPGDAFFLSLGDLAYAILFAVFLLQRRNRTAA